MRTSPFVSYVMNSRVLSLLCGALLAIAMPAVAVVPYTPPITAGDVAARKEQAARGDKNAQAELAYWYFTGANGLPLDLAEAAKWYLKAAEQEDEMSQRQLAAMYEFGEGLPANHAEALRWIHRALTHYSGASNLIAGRYRSGSQAPKDARKAVEWYRISADAGDIDAQNMLGETYEFGEGIQNYAEAAKWYRLAASAPRTLASSRAVAMFNLGRLYAFGRGVTQNYAEAVSWYNRAIDAGSINAWYGLGLLYEQGFGVVQSATRAMELYYLAAPVNREARDRLFLLYERDLPLPQDDGGAIEWYRTAAQQGDARAQAGLGLRYKFGKGVERDWSIAFALFEVAARSSQRSSVELPEFRAPRLVLESYTTPMTRGWVEDMATPGNFLHALDRIQRMTPAEREAQLSGARPRTN